MAILSNFKKLMIEIRRGMAGKNRGIPMGFNRLNKYIGIRKFEFLTKIQLSFKYLKFTPSVWGFEVF